MLLWLNSVAWVEMSLWQVFVALVDVALANICRLGMYVALEKVRSRMQRSGRVLNRYTNEYMVL